MNAGTAIFYGAIILWALALVIGMTCTFVSWLRGRKKIRVSAPTAIPSMETIKTYGISPSDSIKRIEEETNKAKIRANKLLEDQLRSKYKINAGISMDNIIYACNILYSAYKGRVGLHSESKKDYINERVAWWCGGGPKPGLRDIQNELTHVYAANARNGQDPHMEADIAALHVFRIESKREERWRYDREKYILGARSWTRIWGDLCARATIQIIDLSKGRYILREYDNSNRLRLLMSTDGIILLFDNIGNLVLKRVGQEWQLFENGVPKEYYYEDLMFAEYHGNWQMKAQYTTNESMLWRPDGTCICRAQIKGLSDHRMHGRCVAWYSNGVVRSDAVYINGIQNGISREYSEEGDLLLECRYVNGIPDTNSVIAFERNSA